MLFSPWSLIGSFVIYPGSTDLIKRLDGLGGDLLSPTINTTGACPLQVYYHFF